MKIYLFHSGMHHKNHESIRKMAAFNRATLVEGHNPANVDASFDYVVCNSDLVPPSWFPPSCKIIYGPQHLGVPPVPLNHPAWKFGRDPRIVSNTLSPWVRDLFNQECPTMEHVCLPYGIDMDANNKVGSNRTDIVIYCKNRKLNDFNHAIQTVVEKGIHPVVFQYGHYQDHVFKQALENTKFVLWVGCHESQGFAFQETLAKNVPILVWDVRTMCDEHNSQGYQVYSNPTWKATTASYWSDECGLKFYNPEELSGKFDEMMSQYLTFSPRDFIERELSLGPAFKRMFPI